MAQRLLLHLPCGLQVQDIRQAMVVGRHCYDSILFMPQLAPEDPCCQLLKSIQALINDMACLLLWVTRADQILVEQLLAEADMPALNRVVIQTI